MMYEIPCQEPNGMMKKRIGFMFEGNLLFGVVVGTGKASVIVQVEPYE